MQCSLLPDTCDPDDASARPQTAQSRLKLNRHYRAAEEVLDSQDWLGPIPQLPTESHQQTLEPALPHQPNERGL